MLIALFAAICLHACGGAVRVVSEPALFTESYDRSDASPLKIARYFVPGTLIKVQDPALSDKSNCMRAHQRSPAERITRNTDLKSQIAIHRKFTDTAWNIFDVDCNESFNYTEWLNRAWQFELISDQNDDGVITEREFLVGRGYFNRNRSGGDRVLDLILPWHQERFRKLSKGQGRITRELVSAESKALFRGHDLDGNGEVTKSEIARVGKGRQR